MFTFKSEEVRRIETALEVVRECDLGWEELDNLTSQLYRKLAVAHYNEFVMRLPLVRKALADAVGEGLIKVDSIPRDADIYDGEIRIEFGGKYPQIVELTIDLEKGGWKIWAYDCQLDPDEADEVDDFVTGWRF